MWTPPGPHDTWRTKTPFVAFMHHMLLDVENLVVVDISMIKVARQKGARWGTPDLLVCYRGRHHSIELLSRWMPASKFKEREAKLVHKCGGRYHACRTVAEVADALDLGCPDWNLMDATWTRERPFQELAVRMIKSFSDCLMVDTSRVGRATKRGGSVFNRAGIPDIVVLREGRYIGLELKAHTGTLKFSQKREAERTEAAGGSYHVCRTLSEVAAACGHPTPSNGVRPKQRCRATPRYDRPPDDKPVRCTKCGETKLARDFHTQSAKRKGIASHCKPCTAAYERTRVARA